MDTMKEGMDFRGQFQRDNLEDNFVDSFSDSFSDNVRDNFRYIFRNIFVDNFEDSLRATKLTSYNRTHSLYQHISRIKNEQDERSLGLLWTISEIILRTI